MAYIVIAGIEKGVIVRAYETSAEAVTAAAEDADWTAIDDAVTDIVELGDYYDTGEVIIGGQPRHLLRLESGRAALAQIVREFPPVFILADAARSANYVNRMEMLARAMHMEANRTDDARWEIIEAEADRDARAWFSNHDQAAWATALPADRSTWGFFSTGTDGTAGTQTSVTLETSTTFDWLSLLG